MGVARLRQEVLEIKTEIADYDLMTRNGAKKAAYLLDGNVHVWTFAAIQNALDKISDKPQ